MPWRGGRWLFGALVPSLCVCPAPTLWRGGLWLLFGALVLLHPLAERQLAYSRTVGSEYLSSRGEWRVIAAYASKGVQTPAVLAYLPGYRTGKAA